jgi:hypothetical protein
MALATPVNGAFGNGSVIVFGSAGNFSPINCNLQSVKRLLFSTKRRESMHRENKSHDREESFGSQRWGLFVRQALSGFLMSQSFRQGETALRKSRFGSRKSPDLSSNCWHIGCA